MNFNGQLSSDDIEPCSWNKNKDSFQTQRKNILNYLTKYLAPLLPSNVIIDDVSHNEKFLNMKGSPMLPFDIESRTDLILVEKSYMENKTPKAGIRCTIDIKKRVRSSDACQAILDMWFADLFARKEFKVFGVLTDLRDTWNICWIEKERKIKLVSFHNRLKALELISKMASDSKVISIDGLPMIERVKAKDSF